MDSLDRAIVNALQDGLAVCEHPYAEAAARLGTREDELLHRIDALLASGVLTRFGPMFNVDRMGGAFTLAAMSVPAEDFERVAEMVNAFPEVAHNYAREHELNMWFVIATERRERIAEVIAGIEQAAGLRVYDFPKLEEFFVGLRFPA